MTSLEDRLDEVERQIGALVGVCSAVADDTLRMCFVLDEMSHAGHLPMVPWDVATMLVELHHAQSAAKNGLKDADGVSAEQRMAEIRATIVRLRADYTKSLEVM